MKTIVWDVDDVLNDLMKIWFESWRLEHPYCSVGYDELKDNPPDGILGITMDEYLQSLDMFRLSQLYQEMQPSKEVMDWFVRKGSLFRHSVLTAVPLKAAPVSAQWVFRHFGAWVRTFSFLPSKRENEKILEYDHNKGEFLMHSGVIDLFIDDNIANLKVARQAGINTLLFPRPWNDSEMTVAEMLDSITVALA